MKKTEKTVPGTAHKRTMALALSIVMSLTVLMANGCNNKPKTIEDYPDSQPVATVETGDGVTVEILEEDYLKHLTNVKWFFIISINT